jgi:hypothetical protein
VKKKREKERRTDRERGEWSDKLKSMLVKYYELYYRFTYKVDKDKNKYL